MGLAGSSVSAICVDRDDVIWVATRRGLSRFKDDRIFTVTAQHGLPANFFYQIIEDDREHLWLVYGRGILRCSRRELNAVADGAAQAVTAVSFGAEDGMRSTAMVVPAQPTAWKGRDGRVWFATSQGAVVADPATMPRNTVPPPVWIEDLFVDRKATDRLAVKRDAAAGAGRHRDPLHGAQLRGSPQGALPLSARGLRQGLGRGGHAAGGLLHQPAAGAVTSSTFEPATTTAFGTRAAQR